MNSQSENAVLRGTRDTGAEGGDCPHCPHKYCEILCFSYCFGLNLLHLPQLPRCLASGTSLARNSSPPPKKIDNVFFAFFVFPLCTYCFLEQYRPQNFYPFSVCALMSPKRYLQIPPCFVWFLRSESPPLCSIWVSPKDCTIIANFHFTNFISPAQKSALP